MSYESDAVEVVCVALGECFADYGDRRLVSTSARYPMDGVAVVDFSIVARGIEVYGSVSIVVDVADWFGACFVSDFSAGSRRWLEHGPIGVSASEFARELVAAVAEAPEVVLVCPSASSAKAGFHFDLEVY